ncbi:MAG: terminase small subunit [Pseudobacter sp.]|uniref:terminase small subunit n=1 Tax=Pseudobacter sp. TaxID=2045420 RepID=UPI003F7F95EA
MAKAANKKPTEKSPPVKPRKAEPGDQRLGNQWWRLRAKHGRDKEYETPDLLWEEISDYFQECDDNPWVKCEAVKSGDLTGQIIKVPTARPYTLSGLCIHLGISQTAWKNYCKREDFIGVCTHAEEVVKTQKFEGAAVGAFNANIIARDLGLKDSSEVKVTKVGKDLSDETYE